MSQCDDCKYFSSRKENGVINSLSCPAPEKDGKRAQIMEYWEKAAENNCDLFVEKTDEEKKIRDKAIEQYEIRRKSGPPLY